MTSEARIQDLEARIQDLQARIHDLKDVVREIQATRWWRLRTRLATSSPYRALQGRRRTA
jgi:hypothetical protein